MNLSEQKIEQLQREIAPRRAKNSQVQDPHKEAKEWYLKGGQVESRCADRKIYNDDWFITSMPDWNQNAELIEYRPFTHDLTVGMEIPEDILRNWCNIGNEFDEEDKIFIASDQEWVSKREVISFDIKNGEVVFYEKPVNHNGYESKIALRAEGFLGFLKEYDGTKEEAPKEWPLDTWLYCENGNAKWITKALIKRIATKEDIEGIMSVVLEKMGFKKGIKAIRPKHFYPYDKVEMIESTDIFYEEKTGYVMFDGMIVYHDGKFATIVSEEKPTQIANSCGIEFDNKPVK